MPLLLALELSDLRKFTKHDVSQGPAQLSCTCMQYTVIPANCTPSNRKLGGPRNNAIVLAQLETHLLLSYTCMVIINIYSVSSDYSIRQISTSIARLVDMTTGLMM